MRIDAAGFNLFAFLEHSMDIYISSVTVSLTTSVGIFSHSFPPSSSDLASLMLVVRLTFTFAIPRETRLVETYILLALFLELGGLPLAAFGVGTPLTVKIFSNPKFPRRYSRTILSSGAW